MKINSKYYPELAFAIKIAQQAGKLLLSYPKATNISFKENKTPVTAADKAISNLIAMEIKKEFPTYALLDEERADDLKRLKSKFCWVIDPLDGTRGYIAGDENCGPLIGLLHNHQPVLGVAYRPLRGELVYAVRGNGAYVLLEKQAKKIHVSGSKEIHLLISQSRNSPELTEIIQLINPKTARKQNSSFKIIEVAMGRATLFVCPQSNPMHFWDLCATQVILEEAGGKITDMKGNPLNYALQETTFNLGIVASNGKIHGEVLKILKKPKTTQKNKTFKNHPSNRP